MKASAKLLLLVVIALAGCATTGTRSQIDTEIGKAIATDLFSAVQMKLAPARTTITIKPQDEAERTLEALFRQSGYATKTQGDQNLVALHIYYVDADASYIGSLHIGHLTRITRKYRYSPDGLAQIGATAIGG